MVNNEVVADPVYSYKFHLQAGTVERRLLLDELTDWLTENVGSGRVLLHDGSDWGSDWGDNTWRIVCWSTYFRVLLKNQEDTVLFLLRWT